MSTQVMICHECNTERTFDRYAPIGDDLNYGVAWKCPNGHGMGLDICPIGPIVPKRSSCLNCGDEIVNDKCRVCGLTEDYCLADFEITQTILENPMGEANACMQLGLFRRALAIMNRALQLNPTISDAWIIKSRFLHSLGYVEKSINMVETILVYVQNQQGLIELYEELSFLNAEMQNGESALKYANYAIKEGSHSLRTHYLRGRALAQVGELHEALSEMETVLTMEPENADALRGQQMIQNALGPVNEPKRPWWKLW